MRHWARKLGKGLALAVIAGAALAVEIVPTLASAAPDACPRFAAIVAHSSCLAIAYGDAQRIGGRASAPDAVEDASCADGLL